ncbi:MAG: gliding motility-associated C-terminal domain-containing protein, partial [Flavobacteriales bacterium]|nr:gliding motility-associated C-terminal domain-containing protein [Flavobacteriales bacterium]
PGYIYVWNDVSGQTTATATGLCAAVYTVTVTDAAGCTLVDMVTLNDNGGPTTLGEVITNAGCNGDCDGTITLTPSGGIQPYTYLWNTGETTTSLTGLCAGAYSVSVTDALGCTLPMGLTVTEPQLLTTVFSDTTNVSCNGDCIGEAEVTPSGGTPPFAYLWGDGQTSTTATGLCSGAIDVTVTDVNGCTATGSITITEPNTLTASVLSVTDPTCNGVCDGSVATTIAGGTTPYSYVWTDGQTTANATGLCDGVYDLTVTDANGCTAMTSGTVTSPNPIVSNPSSVSSSCGVCDGSVSVAPTGGTSPFTYVWDDASSQTSATATGLCAAAYNVTITDASGCTATDVVILSDNGGATSGGEVITNATCNAACDGQVVLTPVGGQLPYSYQWNDASSQTTATATGLCAGNYIVSISDNNGCLLPVAITITEPAVLAGTFTDSSFVDCGGNCTGMAVLTPTGGTSPYTFVWDDGQTDSTATGLCAGAVGVTVTDVNGCQTTNSITITEPSPLVPTIISSTDLICSGVCVGTAEVAGAGGTLPYSYMWSDGQTDSLATGLCAGSYSVTLTDVNGCADSVSVLILSPSALVGNGTSVNSTCGVCDGSVTIAPTGGTPGYTYVWSDASSQTSATVTGLCAALYYVTITDVNGCVLADQVPLSDNGGPTIDSMSVVDVGCNGNCDGQATVAVSSGNPPFTYLWNDASSQTSATATGLCAGVIYVEVTDGLGCKTVQGDTIRQASSLNLTLVDTVSLSCNGICDGTATVTVNGGTPAYTYLWSDGQANATVTGLCSGIYNITVTDSKGCTGTDVLVVDEPAPLTLSVLSAPSFICNGDTAIVSATAGGGTAPYSYLWNDNLSSTTANIMVSPIDTFLYIVTVTDGNGCTITGSDTLAVISPGVPVMDPDTGICKGDSLLLVGQISGSGTYLWTTNGSGTFVPDNTSQVVHYLHSPTDSVIEIYLTSVGACSNITDTMEVTVGIKAIVNAGLDQEVPIGTKSLQLSGSYQFTSTVIWTSNGSGTFVPNNTDPNAVYFPGTGDYDLDSLVLTLSSTGNGCALASDIMVVKFIEVIIPNVFTPYPESPGVNDVFYIRGLPQGARLTIFNRWGIKVYQSDYYRNDWDAAGVDGEVYYYVLTWEGKYWRGYVQVVKGK